MNRIRCIEQPVPSDSACRGSVTAGNTLSVHCGIRGSLTIYFALTFAVMVSLITACIYSAKVEAGRARTANAADQSLFSLFANYDQSLFDQFQIFMIDGSCGTDHLSASTICSYLSENADYLLQPKKDHFLSRGSALLSLQQTNCALTAYTLATDLNGVPFRAQAVQAEKDTLGTAENKTGRQNVSARNDLSGTSLPASVDTDQSFTDYPASDPEEGSSETESSGETVTVPADFVNPLPQLEKIRRSSLLAFVIDEERNPISNQSVASGTIPLLSSRNPEHGFGIINAEGSSLGASDRLLFQEYLLHHFSCFTDGLSPSGSEIPSYELEYLIAEKDTDQKNLEKTAKKLLLIREGLNFSYLEADAAKHAEISRESLLIAASVGMPGAEPVIQGLFTLAWAFAESLVDLRALFDGKRTAAIKSAASWQTDISDLPHLANGIGALVKDVSGGISYRDYLEFLLTGKDADSLTLHAMDLVEIHMRASGKPDFRLDRCIDSLSFSLSVTSEQRVPLTAEASFSYRQR